MIRARAAVGRSIKSVVARIKRQGVEGIDGTGGSEKPDCRLTISFSENEGVSLTSIERKNGLRF